MGSRTRTLSYLPLLLLISPSPGSSSRAWGLAEPNPPNGGLEPGSATHVPNSQGQRTLDWPAADEAPEWVFVSDSRSPEEVAGAGGLKPVFGGSLPQALSLSASINCSSRHHCERSTAYVLASTNLDVAAGTLGPRSEGETQWVYRVHTAENVISTAASLGPWNRRGYEDVFAALGGFTWDQVHGWAQLPGSYLGPSPAAEAPLNSDYEYLKNQGHYKERAGEDHLGGGYEPSTWERRRPAVAQHGLAGFDLAHGAWKVEPWKSFRNTPILDTAHALLMRLAAPLDTLEIRQVLAENTDGRAEKSKAREAQLMEAISKAQQDAKWWTKKAMEANTPEKLQKVTAEAERAAQMASQAMKDLSHDSFGSSFHTVSEGWDKFVKVFLDRTGAIMIGYRALFATYEKGLKGDRQQLKSLLGKMSDPRRYRTHIDPFRSASAKLGFQVEGALGFLETKHRLATEEPDPHWRRRFETKQEAESRAELALIEGQKVVQQVYGTMKKQLDDFVGGMVDNFIVISKIRTKVRSHQEDEREEARKAELQAVGNEVDEILEALKDALWELSPAAPFKEAYDKISSGEDLGIWGWLTIAFEIGMEILSWVPTPAAPVARAFKVGRTAYKVTKLVRRARRIIDRVNKVCGRVGTLKNVDMVAENLVTILGRFTIVLKNVDGARQHPQAVGPTEDEKKSLLELVQMSEMVALPKRGKLSDRDLQAVLAEIRDKLGHDDIIVDTMRTVVCKSMKPALMASLIGGGGRMGCVMGPHAKPSQPLKPKSGSTPTKPQARPKGRPANRKPKATRAELTSHLLSSLLGRTLRKREAQGYLAKDVEDFYSRPREDGLDLDLADRILEQGLAEISDMDDDGDGDGGPSFLDNDHFLERFSAFFAANGTDNNYSPAFFR